MDGRIQGYDSIPMLDSMAPQELLEFTSCNCGGDCRNQWCSCRKNDVKCISLPRKFYNSLLRYWKGVTSKYCTDEEEPGEDSDLNP